MEKEFVPYELALELKELGFYESCFGVFQTQENNRLVIQYFQKSSLKFATHLLPAPTFSQVFRWFREKYYLLYEIVFYRENKKTKKGYWYNICQWNSDMTKRNIINVDLYFTTYEEAEHACLKKLIEIVKTK